MSGPFATTSRLTPIQQMSLAVLSRAACASMSTTTTTTTTRDTGDRYGPMEWAQQVSDCVCVCVCVRVCWSDVFWYRDTCQLDDINDGRCTVSQRDDGLCRLRLNQVQSRDSGHYLVVAVNNASTCKHTFTVTVTGKALATMIMLKFHRSSFPRSILVTSSLSCHEDATRKKVPHVEFRLY